jgi:HlyD family secretion protein
MDKRKRILAVFGAVAVAVLIWFLARSRDFSYAGTVEAREVNISAGVASPITALKAREGQLVKKGDLLLVLECRDLRAAADLAASDFERSQKLYKAGSLPRSAFDRARFQNEDAATKRGWCDVTAPCDGTVLASYCEEGEWARPGSRLLTLADMSEVWAFFYVEQPMLSRLKPGQEVKGRLAEMPGRKFPGRLAYIRPEAEFTPRNVQTREERTRLVYGVKCVFPNPDGILKPGMTMECSLP